MEGLYCECCGAKLQKYHVKITPMIVNALIKFKQAVQDKNRNEIHLLKDMKGKAYELTRHEWNNFSRQRFLALAVKVENKPGYWLLTARGNAFLKGEIGIPESVTIFRNKIVDRSEKIVFINKVIGSVPYLETKDDIVYQDVKQEEAIEVMKKKKSTWRFDKERNVYVEEVK